MRDSPATGAGEKGENSVCKKNIQEKVHNLRKRI